MVKGGGYKINMPLEKSKAQTMLSELRNNTWLDLHTRVLFVEFAMHNPHLDLLVITRFTLEITAGGSILPSSHIETYRTMQSLLY